MSSMILKNIIDCISVLEQETFSDAWSRDSIEDTLKQDYNVVYSYFLDDKGYSVYRISKEQDILVYSKPYDGEWTIKLISWEDFNVCDDTNVGAVDTLPGRFGGYIIASLIGDETELHRIAVVNDLRGKHIGTNLLDFYMEDADECNRYFLEVRESNSIARALYEKQGYDELAIRKNYYSNPTENAVIYEYQR